MKRKQQEGKKLGKGYLRFHRQLTALKKNDLFTVKKLAEEARSYLATTVPGKTQMRLLSA